MDCKAQAELHTSSLEARPHKFGNCRYKEHLDRVCSVHNVKVNVAILFQRFLQNCAFTHAQFVSGCTCNHTITDQNMFHKHKHN